MTTLNTPLFIVTAAGYFFETRQQFDFDKLINSGCRVCFTKPALYAHLVKHFGYDLEEVENAEYVIQNGSYTCMMGYTHEIEGNPEDFLINFEI